MKLLVVIPSMQRGGAERVVSLLCREWVRNHEVILALFDTTAPAYEISARVVDLRAASAFGILRKLINPVLRVKRLARLIRREQPDRIFSFMESANFPAVLASWLCGREQYLTVSVRDDPLSFPWFYRWLMPCLYRLAHRVVAVSQGVADRLRFMGVARRGLSVITNPVDRNILQRRAAEPAPTGQMDEETFILGVGRLDHKKGFDRLIEAFARLPCPELKLVILGEGPERSRLEHQVSLLGLESRVLLPGAVENPFPFYRRAQCFVLCSRYEGFPNVLLEAMALACPVVAFDCDYGPREIIMDGNNGLLVQEGDIEGLVRAISRLNEDAGLRNRVVGSASVTVDTLFSTKVAKYWLEA